MTMADKLPAYRYRVAVLRVIDGDTLEARVDLGFYAAVTVHLRLFGINCPELPTPEGKAARGFVVDTLAKADPDSITAATLKPDKYGGRWDAVVWVGGVSLNDLLIQTGHVVPFLATSTATGPPR